MVAPIKTAQRAPLLSTENSSRSYSTFSHLTSSRNSNSNMAATLNEKQVLGRPFDEEALAAAQLHQQPTAKPRRFKYALLGAAAATFMLYGSGVCSWKSSARETAPSADLHKSAVESTHDFTSRAAADETCSTDACKSYADSVKAARALNYTDIDPCTDFGNYVCGNWYNTHDYRPEQSSVNTLSIMSDVNNAVVRAILESPYPADNSTYSGINATLDKENFEMLQKVYSACMDTDTIKEVGAKPLQDVLASFQESYEPSSLTGTNSTANLTDALIWLQRYGVSVLVGASTAADDRNPNVTLITLGSGSTGLPSKQYYNNTKALANYTIAITGMFDNLFPGNSSHQDLAKKIIALETLIARAEPDPEQSSDVTYYYNPMKVADAEKLIPEISFSRLLAAFVPEGYTNDTVIVNTPDYYPQLSTILKNASSDALYGLLQWNLIQSWSGRVDGNISYPIRRLSNELAGRDANATSQRWQTCLTEVDTNLPWIESAFFIYRAFSTESKVLGDRIVDDIKAIFTEKLKGYEWMTDAVKTKAAQKVTNIVKKIGYPDVSPNVLNPKSISDFYSCLTVSNSSYFENGLAFNKFSSRAAWSDLLKPTDKNRWFMTTPTVNAYYNPPSNEIAFPAGIMQTPVFDLDLPEYVSYAAFGAVAGHELTHAFDDSGSHYDENGAFRDWWDNSTLANFEKKTQCFADQYSKYTITTPEGEKLNVNGQLTNGENIADSGGLSAAYSAWIKREADKPNAVLPGLEEYTKDQLFYLAFGNLWCGKRRPAEAVRRIYTDPHSPGEFRIFGTVSNQRGFKEAFKCANKEPVCELW